MLYFPHYCTREFNDYHKYLFAKKKFGERDIRQADAAPRGSAKSTITTLIEPIHDVCYGTEKFILMLSSTGPLANKKLKDIRTEIQSNVALRAAYGVQFPKKNPGASEFYVDSPMGRTYFAALGRGSEVRGIRDGENRPTKIISDDVEFSEEVYNEQSRKKTEDWYFEDIVKAGDTGTNFKFVGTILHKESLLAKLLKNPAYKGRLFQAIISWSEREDLWNKWREIYRNMGNPTRLEEAQAFYEANKDEMLKGTKVLWPEKEDYLAHMKDMEEIGRRAFMKEKQNDPQGNDDQIFEKFHYYTEVPEGFKIEATGEIVPWNLLRKWGAAQDPATGQTKPTRGAMGDFAVIVTGCEDHVGRVFVHHDWTKRASPTKQIQAIFDLFERFKFEKFAVETNLYRNLLLPNILDEKARQEKEKKKKLDISFYDVIQTENKRERIYRLEPKVNHGRMLFNRALSQEYMSQFQNFPNGTHDDCPDATEILWNLFKNRYKPMALGVDPMAGR